MLTLLITLFVLLFGGCMAGGETQAGSLDLRKQEESGSLQGFFNGEDSLISNLLASARPQQFIFHEGIPPVQGVFHLGSSRLAFIVDSDDPWGDGLNRLSIDLNGDGLFSENEQFQSPPVSRIHSDRFPGWTNCVRSEFYPLDTLIEVEGKMVDYSFRLVAALNYDSRMFGWIDVLLLPTIYREGFLELAGEKRKVILLDANSNGRFDDFAEVDEVYREQGSLHYPGIMGDRLYLHPEVEQKASNSPNWDDYHWLGNIVRIDRNYYTPKVTPSGDRLSLKASDLPQGFVSASREDLTIDLYSDQGMIHLCFEEQNPQPLPAGVWNYWKYNIGSGIGVRVHRTRESSPFVVTENEKTLLRYGPPYDLDWNLSAPEYDAKKRRVFTDIEFTLRGQDKEMVEYGMNPEVRLHIENAQGQIFVDERVPRGLLSIYSKSIYPWYFPSPPEDMYFGSAVLAKSFTFSGTKELDFTIPRKALVNDAPYDLGLKIRGQIPFLVEQERSVTGELRMRNSSGKWLEKKIKVNQEVICLDRFTNTKLSQWSGERYFLQHFLLENKEIRDCELNGITLKRTGVDDKQPVSVADGRTISKECLNRLALQGDSFGLMLDLPEAVLLGDSFEVDFLSLAPFLLDTSGTVEKASGTFTLTKVDKKQTEALCKGTVDIIEETLHDGRRLQLIYSLETDFTVDLKARMLSRLNLNGEANAANPNGDKDIEGEMQVRIAATVQTGKAAEKAEKKEPVFRYAQRILPDKGVRLSLPSHWYYQTRGEEGIFSSTFNTESDYLRLVFKRTPAHGSPIPEVLQFLEEELRAKHEDAVTDSVKSGLGSGRSVGYTNKKGVYCLEEFFVLGRNHFLTIRFFGKGDRLKAGLKEYKKIRKKIKALDK